MDSHISNYHNQLQEQDKAVCIYLNQCIQKFLPQANGKIWHAHPVWFINENPIVGYSKLKKGVQLMFWSGQSFTNAGLIPNGKFKAATITYQQVADIDIIFLKKWLEESALIQWDYKNIVKRKGILEPLF